MLYEMLAGEPPHLGGSAQQIIAVSCATLTDSLVESELFGHVKGSFTGATEDRMGCFELADGSTLLLDEAGDLSLSAQAKILRVLETRTLRRVGGTEEITVNVRVIAATNSSLEERVRSGSFRRDLFHRVQPALRPRLEHRLELGQGPSFMRSDTRPVTIVGGGVSGITLAVLLAERGLQPLAHFDLQPLRHFRCYAYPGPARWGVKFLRQGEALTGLLQSSSVVARVATHKSSIATEPDWLVSK